MEIRQASFVMSNTQIAKCPAHGLAEYAFIGRSNVGKSSLINMLTNHKGLAKTSSKPGKTQLINHFLINKNWYLVDLPGYGYAQVSKQSKRVFQQFITDYFKKRKELVCAFVLVDIRHKPQKIDLEFMQWLGENTIPFAIIFTKADKLTDKLIEEHITAYQGILLEQWEEMPPYFISSSVNKLGRTEILNYIEDINNSLTH
ncbi:MULTISPECIES: ribosome biogenesis GTP-binding protein YihA/YsxC [unclassified Capnocytophaga]|jgi:ribosome biogenesis GTP-binding protein YsxC/EngB|uniref:ribosome biogenesis GTP-binding protein YihA/YsxC n=1 Tax=unclassified Capnocytophaga TaxID=2640652 RepID=UPI000202B324|nr:MULTISPECIES: ribosome biogenesis GTP-binding protein YihA/YsxC [unclassified Capnocytophaga]EGD34083.1 ribosome biogenesis GTP-binding protein YsxC [Capnocytophaga sp. oral taxon 338 str. F0234]MEB3004382.1 ribosome biogenesis GTP-binding protein YihA/YsxC [Capnocytophaga sp. G2]